MFQPLIQGGAGFIPSTVGYGFDWLCLDMAYVSTAALLKTVERPFEICLFQ